MPEISSATFSETDASNTTMGTGASMAEGCPPSNVNDAARAVAGALKRFWGRIQGEYASTGSANAYVLTPSVALAAYVTGERYSFRANFTNTGTATLQISGIASPVTIKKFATTGKVVLVANDIVSGQPVTVEYDGTDMVMVTPASAMPTLGANTFTGLQTLTGAAMDWAAIVAVTPAATTAIGAAASNYINITGGTTTITAFDSIHGGTLRILFFNVSLTLTHNSSTLVLPGGASITTAQGDVALMISEGGGSWRCINYMRADSRPIKGGKGTMWLGGNGSQTAGQTLFYGPSLNTATEGNVQFAMPFACTISNLYIGLVTAPVGAETVVSTMRKAGSDQTLTVTITGAAVTGSDTTHSFTAAAGDLISAKVVFSGSAASSLVRLSFQYESTN